MRFLSILVFLMGAALVGSYAYAPTALLRQNHMASLVEIQSQSSALSSQEQFRRAWNDDAAFAAARGQDGARSFSPSSPLFRVAATTSRADARTPVVGASPSRHSIEQAGGQAGGQAAVGDTLQWRTQIIPEAGVAATAPRVLTPQDYVARVEMARHIQRELKRVGCYAGDVDGDWGPGSKRAMAGFLERVNATLPADNPDYVLLSLVQGHADQACGVSCAAGQGLSSDGRCLPSVLMVRAPEKRPAVTASKWATVTTPAATTPAMAPTGITPSANLANIDAVPIPTLVDRRTARLPKVVTAFTPPERSSPAGRTRVISVAEALTTSGRDNRLDGAAGPGDVAGRATVSRPTVLPGRMAMGAPIPAEAQPLAVLPPLGSGSNSADEPAGSRQINSAIQQEPDASPARPQGTERSRRHRARDYDRERYDGVGASRVRPSPIARPSTGSSRRYNSGGYVKTSQGRVRRGSPQHNLMLSLGGVF
ncbi:MAG: hypothetical protein KDJ37_11695 [Hyphomicrobiaceae bacterium]|nr:hypothetical protein [Hyphomicrobiaceae bacterium]